MQRTRHTFNLQDDLKKIFYKNTPPDYDGIVLLWDLDKTYLATQFDTLLQLFKTALEKPIHKQNIPGAKTLLQQLQRSSLQKNNQIRTIFLSASPEQMRSTISEKLILDEVEFDLIICKNQWQYLKARDFAMLKEQIGYKLKELLLMYQNIPHAQFITFGDDREFDATIYSLFADITAKKIARQSLINLLKMLGVRHKTAVEIAWLARQTPRGEPLKKAFIFLESSSDSFYYQKYGHKFLATHSYLQTMTVLFEMNLLNPDDIGYCLEEMGDHGLNWRASLVREILDLVARGHLNNETLDQFFKILQDYTGSTFAEEKFAIRTSQPYRIFNKKTISAEYLKSTEPSLSNVMEIKYKYMDEIKVGS